MASFSKGTLNTIEWNGVADLIISDPNITEVIVTGNPTTGIPRSLFLPEVDSSLLYEKYTIWWVYCY